MASIPYMPLYISDYLADAAHLSTLEHGAYMLLIMTYWQRQKPLPNSNERLANVARMSIEQWMSVRDTLSEFFSVDGENWVHKRIDAELAIFFDKSEKAKAAGRISAQKRMNKCSTNAEHPLNDRSASAEQTYQRNGNHTDTNTDTDKNLKNKNTVKNFSDETEKIFQHWKITMGHLAAKLDDKRKRIIREALKSGYNEAQLCQAITGCSLTPHNMGHNDRGERYDGLNVILRNADQIDRFITNARSPPRAKNKTEMQMQSNIDVGKRWLDGKMSKEVSHDRQ